LAHYIVKRRCRHLGDRCHIVEETEQPNAQGCLTLFKRSEAL
jgi:hypothetical protein